MWLARRYDGVDQIQTYEIEGGTLKFQNKDMFRVVPHRPRQWRFGPKVLKNGDIFCPFAKSGHASIGETMSSAIMGIPG